MSEEKNTSNRRTVLITGASRGIGKSIAEIFAKEGYNLVMLCHNSLGIMLQAAQELSEEYGVSIYCYSTDVSSSEEVKELFRELAVNNITIDILINNAGISYVGLLQDMTDEDWNSVIQTNLSAAFYTSRGVLPSMIERKEGRILNISSVWGNVGASTEAAYSASKGGLNAFTKALAKEVAPSGISVNAIACGYIDTEMNNHLSIGEKESLFDEIPSGRPGTPDEVAEFVYQIATSSKYLTGQVIKFDGGWI
ncbi:MAG: SDR family NAD(P)-dependent oxidoreductase [Lachnospiraceae bacterium]|nr:SDR family NAD(P)-dependent oxidoreductase [Lachnospiraceae bacterium]